MDGVDAAYEYAGIVGIRPHGLTLRQLWRMAIGEIRQRRWDAWSAMQIQYNDDMDHQKFLETGSLVESCVGKPLVLSPENEAKVQAEIDRIRRENPNLPQYNTIG
jgi:hypothetical protein